MNKKTTPILYSISATFLVVSLLLCAVKPATITRAAGWLAGGWDQRVEITVSNTNIDNNLSHYPIPIFINSTAGKNDNDDLTPIFDEVGSNSKKIAVTKDDGTSEIYVEVEKWDNTGEDALIWVSSSTLTLSSSSTTTLYLYYDNDHADNTTYVGTVGSRPEVWDSDYEAVFHFADSSGAITDSTSNNNDGTVTAGAAYQETGSLGYALDLDKANSEKMTFAAINPLSNSLSIEMFTKLPVAADAFDGIISIGTAGQGDNNRISIYTTDNNEYVVAVVEDGNGNASSISNCRVGPTDGPQDGDWHPVTFVIDRDDDQLRAYFDGANTDTDSLASVGSIDNSGDWNLAYDATLGHEDVTADELRISSTERTASWLRASHYFFNDDVLDFGSPGTPTPTPTVTNTPTETLTPTVTNTPTLTPTGQVFQMADPSVVIAQDLIDEVQAALEANIPTIDANLWAITDVYTVGNYSMISIAGLDVDDPNDLDGWFYEDAIWTGTAIVRDNLDTSYTTGLDGDATYTTLLGESSFSDPNDGADQGGGGGNWIWLPFMAGTRANYGVRGVHAASNALPGWKAVDWFGGSTYGDNSMPNIVYGSWTEPIKSVCRDGTSIGITTENFYYIHLEENTSIQPGALIRQGQPIGSLVTGSFSDRCGWAVQHATSYHVHWGWRPTGDYFQAESWVLNINDEIWRRGDDEVAIRGYMLAEWPGHDGIIPTLGPTVTPGGPTLTPAAAPPPVAYGGDSLWDPIISGLYSMAETTAARFPEHEESGIGSQITSGAEIAIRVAFTMLTSNFDLTISIIVFGMIASAEVVRLIYAIYLGVKKLIPVVG